MLSEGLLKKVWTANRTRTYKQTITLPQGVYRSQYDFIRETCEEHNKPYDRASRFLARVVQSFLTYVIPVNVILTKGMLKYSPRDRGYVVRED